MVYRVQHSYMASSKKYKRQSQKQKAKDDKFGFGTAVSELNWLLCFTIKEDRISSLVWVLVAGTF